MAEPRCPDCGVSGSKRIVSTASEEKSRDKAPWFFIAHCDDCGHVYGIFTKHVFGKDGPRLIVERGA